MQKWDHFVEESADTNVPSPTRLQTPEREIQKSPAHGSPLSDLPELSVEIHTLAFVSPVVSSSTFKEGIQLTKLDSITTVSLSILSFPPHEHVPLTPPVVELAWR